ncbi:MAG: sugar-binding protein [Phycisphaeraceae bacterium JB051]
MLTRCLTLILCLLFVTVANAKPQYTCYQLDPQRKLTIDGDLSDWPNVPIMLVGKQHQVTSGTWTGPGDSHAKVRMTWDKDTFYMSIEVIDNQVTQNTTRDRAHTIYQMDALQWAVDLKNDGGTGYGDDNYEYGFGVADNEPVVYRWHASKGWPRGIAEHAKLAVKPHPQGGVIYEAAIDYSMLTPLRNPEDGQQIGFCIALQDQDGKQHKTLQWGRGIADGKKPWAFGKINFSRATPSNQDGGLMISANKEVAADGLNLVVMSSNGSAIKDGPLLAKMRDHQGKPIGDYPMKLVDQSKSTYQVMIPTKDLKANIYHIAVVSKNGKQVAKHGFRRSNIEQLDGLMAGNIQKADELQKLIAEAEAQGLQTHYPKSVLASARVFEPFMKEDVDELNFEVALHNAHTLDKALGAATKQLQDWMAAGSTPAMLQIPDLDYSQTKIAGRNLEVDGRPVMLVGPGSWLWQINSDIQKISDIGYNYAKFGWMGHHHFDEQGQMIKPKDKPYWASNKIFNVGKQNKMAIGISMFCPDQVWRGAERRGELTLGEFHKIYDTLATSEIPRISNHRAWDYTIEVEKQRCPVTYEPEHHKQMWVDYLASQYSTIDKLNSLYHSQYASFDAVEFPKSEPTIPAQRYDWVRLRQMMIGNELTRAANKIRSIDTDAIVHGYPYVWTFREPAAYYGAAIDPELDTAAYDMVGCDTSGAYHSDRYALATIGWLAGYYDLMRSIAADRPLSDGEYHYVNRRKIYPQNWSRAIYFQSYMHGLSHSSAWVWNRNGRVDCSLLLDAAVLLGSGQAALDLQRVSPQIAAFHNRPDDVVILYSNASSPHSRRVNDGMVLSQTVQTDAVYEAMYFAGMQVGYVTETHVKQGKLAGKKLLIVPNSSHVERATRDAVEAFARSGGRVILVGDCLKYTPQGEPQPTMVKLPTIKEFEGFSNVDQARKALLPLLASARVLPNIGIKVDNGQAFPTVEWRTATDASGNDILYVMNMGHAPATVNLPKAWDGAVDLLDAQTMNPQFKLESLQFRLLKKNP